MPAKSKQSVGIVVNLDMLLPHALSLAMSNVLQVPSPNIWKTRIPRKLRNKPLEVLPLPIVPTNGDHLLQPKTTNIVIDGKHMFYFYKTKHWMLDKRHPSNQPQGDTANTTSTASSGQISDNGNRRSPDLEAALANTTRAIESSLRGLVNQFTNT